MSPRRAVFVGADPPGGRAFDWVVEPAARVSLTESVRLPDIRVVKELLDEAVPVIEALTVGTVEALLRDELFQLVLSVARVEATLRSLDSADDHTIVASQQLSRPSRPGRLGAGLAHFLDADLEWTGRRHPQRFPAGLVGWARAWRWSRGGSGFTAAPIVAAVGGPSERRALEPVCDQLEPGSFAPLDFSLQPEPGLPSFGSFLTRRDAFRSTGHRAFLARAIEIWGSSDWWGSRWLPWVRESLSVMSRITLREAVLFREAALRALADSKLLVTAKVRYARARAIVAAAGELGLITVGMQHGMYVDGNEWTDIRTDVFAASGESFAGILERRGYDGEILRLGAPFYRIPDQDWDCGIALQPAEGVVIASPVDYERHARWAYGAARDALGEDASIGFRLHPRQDERALRKIVGDGPPISRDPDQGARLWVTIESSFVVEAVLSEAPVVLINFNGHPWEYAFADMPGSRVATTEEELRIALTAMKETGESAPVDVWRSEFATATGDEAAAAIARVLIERVG